MSLAESLWVALDALAANKLRTALTMIGIIIGVCSVVAIMAIGRSTEEAVLSELSDFSTGMIFVSPAQPDPDDPNGAVQPLTEHDMESLRHLIPEVKDVLTEFEANARVGYGRRTRQARVTGVQAQAIESMPIRVAEGRWFTPEEEARMERVVVIGADVARRLFDDEVSPVGRAISIGGYSFEVIGVMEKDKGLFSRLGGGQEDLSYRVPLKWLQRATGNYDAHVAIVIVKPGADPEQVAKDAVALVERNHQGARYESVTIGQISKNISKVTSVITGVLAAIAGFSLVVGGVGIMNIMLVSVTERTREIGVRKAIGASYSDILTQFLIEAVILCLLGGAIGLALAGVPVWLVGRWLRIDLAIDWVTITLAVGFSVGVGIIFGVYPASKAARLHPIEALRYE